MDITPLFKACIKTVRTRNKAFGIQSPANDDKQRILKSKSKSGFMSTAKDITLQITKLRDFLLQHREAYLSFFNNVTGDEMSETDRDQIDTGAQRIINTCQHLLKEFRNDNRKITVTTQTREFMDNVIDLIDAYLKAVCKIHSELKALRVKRALDIRKLSRLEIVQKRPSITSLVETVKENLPEQNDQTEQRKLDLSENETAVIADEGLSAEELQMFESENLQLLNELNSMTEEVRVIESKVLHIAELQEIFTEKVLQQEQDIDRIANTVVGATENVKDANEQIKQAIQRNAGLSLHTFLSFSNVIHITFPRLELSCILNFEDGYKRKYWGDPQNLCLLILLGLNTTYRAIVVSAQNQKIAGGPKAREETLHKTFDVYVSLRMGRYASACRLKSNKTRVVARLMLHWNSEGESEPCTDQRDDRGHALWNVWKHTSA
ncbi:Syntaxin-18 [Eumeta japonica]|uniref:Syntaxin-18 n=1 Tax=Eumeta variegata TaxID=151549 RepID=A0A4C1U686_EUMVA|nr:Syntaxin-18 [Eumeta japonica]